MAVARSHDMAQNGPFHAAGQAVTRLEFGESAPHMIVSGARSYSGEAEVGEARRSKRQSPGLIESM